MADNYEALLNRGWDEIPQPKTLPVGSWLLKARNAAYIAGDVDQGKSPRVVFFYTPKEPMNDVDSAELSALGNDYDLASNQITKTFFIESNRNWDDVRNFLNLHGVETKGKTQIESLKAFKGTEIVSYLGVKTFTDKQTGNVRVDNEPKSFAKVE